MASVSDLHPYSLDSRLHLLELCQIAQKQGARHGNHAFAMFLHIILKSNAGIELRTWKLKLKLTASH